MNNVCICGGGALGHVIAGVLANQKAYPLNVNVLTNRPEKWSNELIINAPDGAVLKGNLTMVSSNPKDVIPQSDIVIVCLPGHLIKEELKKISAYLSDGTYCGCVFSSTGFFFEAQKLLPQSIKLWGFQRVPYIARISDYGHSANLLGYKKEHKIAIERATDKEKEMFRNFVEKAFDCPTVLLNNYLEASITNSNPLLHTSRLYTMFKDWHPGVTYHKNYLFYEEWTEAAADLYIKMDAELAELIKVLPVAPDFLPGVLDYYESYDAASLKNKLSSIESFKGITSPMKEIESGRWIPDFESRYFVEDFGCSLKYIYDLIIQYNLTVCPNIEMVYNWGVQMIK